MLGPQTKEYAGCSLGGWLVAALPAPIVADVCCWETLDLLLGSVAELPPPRSSWSCEQNQGPRWGIVADVEDCVFRKTLSHQIRR